MWARSSLLSLAALAACGHKAHKPEADPAKVAALAAKSIDNSPVPVAVRECKPEELAAPVTVTFRTLQELAGQKPGTGNEQAEWINPHDLDTPAVRTFVETMDATQKREAAAELLAAPAWLVYRIDLVNAPMALGVKELKTGTVGMRLIRYDNNARPVCVTVFNFQNTPEKTEWAISITNKSFVDAAVAKELRDDLKAQLIKLLPRGVPAPAK
ncbi:MAG TPA: hypothetical protein VFQ65_19710 [Kofleriaceae bacterium]|nr:hypothetical protein [Kofleriaceae bacterium]